MRNLEFKARVSDLHAALRRGRVSGGELWGDLRQTDTYFATPTGRLKLRETAGFPAELVYYDRDESDPNRPSDYEIARSPDADALRSVLTRALGVLTVVRKRRTLVHVESALLGNSDSGSDPTASPATRLSRVHFDNVEQLGTFVEIEVPVPDGESDAAPAEDLEALIRILGLSHADGITSSYLDLMLSKDPQGADVSSLNGLI